MAKKPEDPGGGAPFNNPFANLGARRDELPPGKPPPPPKATGPARAVIRLERKGHGGKEMTRVEKLELKPAELEKWLKELKQALGCGGAVDGGDLLIQGDQRERLPPLLEKRGVRKVTLG